MSFDDAVLISFIYNSSWQQVHQSVYSSTKLSILLFNKYT